jgi:hypothetical protein
MPTMPRHPLPSYGRIDQPSDAPAPFRIISARQQAQPEQQQQPLTANSLAMAGLHAYNESYAAFHAQQGSREDLTPEQIQRALKEFDTSPLDDFERVSENRVTQADQAYQQVIKTKAAAVDNDSYMRVRDRLHDKLEHSDSPVSTAQEVIANAPAEELGVVLQEVHPWLENRGHSADFVPAALNQNPAAADVKAAAEALTRAKQSAVIAHQTARQIRTAVQNGSPAQHLMSVEDAARYDPDKVK